MSISHKYRAKKTFVDGIAFDSQKEAKRWQELKLLERAGKITKLERQIPIELAKGVKLVGDKRARPPIRLIVDFKYLANLYTDDLCWVYEDVKGMDLPIGRLKRHLAKAIHDIDVRIV